jgi:predicted PurR-regulated permease PerM
MRRRSTVRWLIVIGMALTALVLFWHIPKTLTAFALGGFIAFGLFPIVEWMVRRGLPRVLAIALSYLMLVAIIAVLAVLIVPATLGQVQALAANGPAFAHGAQGMLRDADLYVRRHFGLTIADANLQQFFSDRVGDLVNTSALSAYQVLVEVFTAAFITLTALVLSAFFLSYGKSIADPIYELISPRRQPQARLIGLEIAHVFGGFVAGQVVLSAIVGVLSWASCLVAGFSFSLLVGVIAGIAYAVPFVGQIAAHGIALVLAAPQGLQTVAFTQIALFIVFRIADNVLAPRIFAGSVGVSPVVVIFAVFAGGELFGLPGLLLGIPTAALVRVLFKYLVLPQLDRSRDLPPLGEEAVAATPSPSAPVR